MPAERDRHRPILCQVCDRVHLKPYPDKAAFRDVISVLNLTAYDQVKKRNILGSDAEEVSKGENDKDL